MTYAIIYQIKGFAKGRRLAKWDTKWPPAAEAQKRRGLLVQAKLFTLSRASAFSERVGEGQRGRHPLSSAAPKGQGLGTSRRENGWDVLSSQGQNGAWWTQSVHEPGKLMTALTPGPPLYSLFPVPSYLIPDFLPMSSSNSLPSGK